MTTIDTLADTLAATLTAIRSFDGSPKGADIAEAIGCSPKSVGGRCRAALAQGFVVRNDDGTYALTESGEALFPQPEPEATPVAPAVEPTPAADRGHSWVTSTGWAWITSACETALRSAGGETAHPEVDDLSDENVYAIAKLVIGEDVYAVMSTQQVVWAARQVRKGFKAAKAAQAPAAE